MKTPTQFNFPQSEVALKIVAEKKLHRALSVLSDVKEILVAGEERLLNAAEMEACELITVTINHLAGDKNHCCGMYIKSSQDRRNHNDIYHRGVRS